MNTSTLIILIAVIICLALVVFNHFHKKHLHYHVEGLTQFVTDTLAASPNGIMERRLFLKNLRDHYNCSVKEALWLLGRAKEKGVVKYNDTEVTLLVK